MSTLSKLARMTYQASRAERATRDPQRYLRNRAKSRLMSATGVWSLWRKWWSS